ncbi:MULTISPECIES: NAD-dependent epimerase/dehydratase family protein [Cellulomonas]|uniref:NAD-dependent epimerase/dehydratase family protein n=1 Tax=Cellulomonas TaxID=1707 RepID=UPI000B3C4871|nr:MULTISPECIES: NAD-dependent epimerase/dehydratase family protein [Cellulomonas]MBO9556714.1 NAD-dependent epimerase/dehydratase family protein [Cellulomonas sp.]
MSAEPRCVVVGGTGLVGHHVLRALRAAGLPATGVARTPGPRDVGVVAGDVTAGTDALRRLLDGADVVVHAAPYVGPDPDESARVNVTGSRALVAACTATGVDRLVYVSTAAVYGAGPHRDLSVDDGLPAPRSAVSRHRWHAETLVRSAGGLVVRPHLVVGVGDRHVVPPLARFVTTLGALPESADRTRCSVIGADDLGRLVAGLARHAVASSSTWNAVPPTSVTTTALCALATRALGDELPRARLDAETVRRRALAAGFTARQHDVVFGERTYDPGDVWEAARVAPPRTTTLGDHAVRWYREHASDREPPSA